MNDKQRTIDMLHGPLAWKILLFTIPIALSSMVQQLFNAADLAVVGMFNDANALAAVGANTEIVAFIVTVSGGLSVGANLLVAGKIGRGENKKLGGAACSALFLALLIGISGELAGQLAVKPLLELMQAPATILPDAQRYLRIYLLAFPFLLLYDFESALLRACGDSRYPFVVLVISGIVNVILNLIFVAGLRMGVAGVATATAISTILSAVIVFLRLQRDERFAFDPRRLTVSRKDMAVILKFGIPTAVQGAVFSFSNLFIQSAVNTYGETAIAGSTIAINFEYFTYYIITAFGQAVTTFAGQNCAAGQWKRCRQIFGWSLLFALVCSCIPIFTIVAFRSTFCGMFTSDSAVIEAACVRILCILFYEPISNLYEIPAGFMRGTGHPVYPAAAMMVGTCAFRILWILTAYGAHPSLVMLYHAYPLSYLTTMLLVGVGFFLRWKRGLAA